MPKEKKYVATLTRGKTYILLLEGNKSLEFLKGQSKIISEEHKLLIEEHAKDNVTVGGAEDEETGNEQRDKFTFKLCRDDTDLSEEDEDENSEEPKAPPARRRRPQA